MKPTLTDLEDALIQNIAASDEGGFYASVELNDEYGGTVCFEAEGRIDSDGIVSITGYVITSYDSNGDETECPYWPDIRRVEKESSDIIRNIWREIQEIQDTEEMLMWGGWFI